MKKYLNCWKAAIMAIVLLLASALPAQADVAPSKTALIEMISKETKRTGVERKDIVRMVNAAFKEGKKQNIDPFLIISLMNTESKFRFWAKSGEGARGLMQVIPRWHRDKIKGRDIHHIETNIEVGTKVLANCLKSRKGDIKKALNCYSGGARNYAAKLKAGYIQARSADVIYRFKHHLPLIVVAKFEEPNNFSTLQHKSSPVLAGVKPTANEQVLLASLGP